MAETIDQAKAERLTKRNASLKKLAKQAKENYAKQMKASKRK